MRSDSALKKRQDVRYANLRVPVRHLRQLYEIEEMKKKRIFYVLAPMYLVGEIKELAAINVFESEEYIMFDYDLELKKFKPAVGVEIGEDELFSDDIKDITDLVEELVAEREGKKASK